MRYHHNTVDNDYEPNHTVDVEYERCKELWAAVMKIGLIDAANEFPEGGRATRWLHSAEVTVGSFEWLCLLFDWDSDAIRSQARMNFRHLRRTRVPAVAA